MSNVLGPKLSPQILKNRGIPVRVHVLEQDGAGRWSRVYDEQTGEALTEQVWVQLTNDVIASIETHWGGLAEWQSASASQPFQSIGNTLAIVFDWWKDNAGGTEVPDWRRAGKAMLDGSLEVYNTAVGAAFMLANGVAADRVGKALTDGIEATEKARQRLVDSTVEQLDKASQTPEQPADELPAPAAPATRTPRRSSSTGQRGSNSGAASAARSTSSGD